MRRIRQFLNVNPSLWLLGVCALGGSFVAAFLVPFVFDDNIDAAAYRGELARLQATRTSLDHGAKDGVEFYDARGTAELLKYIQGAPNVRWLRFTVSDLNTDAMTIVRSFPELRELTLRRCQRLDDATLTILAGHEAIENLELTQTRVTATGLSALQTLPNLRKLRLGYDTIHGTKLGDVNLNPLIPCSKLNELELQGEWANDAEIAAFKKARPDCEVRSAPLAKDVKQK